VASEPDPRDRLFLLITGYRVTHMIAAAVRLKIPDRLAAGPRSAGDLAAEAGVQAESLRRVLRGLAAFDILNEMSDGKFELGALGGLLRQDTADSLAPLALLLTGRSFAAWQEIDHSLQTGSTAVSKVYAETGFQHMAKDAGHARVFNAAMMGISLDHARQLVDAYDFAEVELVADLGGGVGTLVGEVLARHSRARGILFDLPAGIGDASAYLRSMGVLERCELVAGDFFASVPTGADLYFLKQVLHDWSDDDSIRILTNCERAMKSGARLLVVEQVAPDQMHAVARDQVVAVTDLHMMVALGGRERTLDEFNLLLEAAALRFTRALPLPHGPTIIEAVKP
jgi:hypothetical protein